MIPSFILTFLSSSLLLIFLSLLNKLPSPPIFFASPFLLLKLWGEKTTFDLKKSEVLSLICFSSLSFPTSPKPHDWEEMCSHLPLHFKSFPLPKLSPRVFFLSSLTSRIVRCNYRTHLHFPSLFCRCIYRQTGDFVYLSHSSNIIPLSHLEAVFFLLHVPLSS